MRRSFWILLTMAALTLATVGIMSVAGADEALANGDYTLTVPGVGDVTLNVDGSTVTVTAAPDGFTDLVDLVVSTSDDGEFVLASDSLSIEVEVEDGTFDSEVKVDLGRLEPGDHTVTIGTYSFTITVGEDGALSMDQPDGFTLVKDGEHLKLTSNDGSITIEIKAEDGRFEASVSTPETDGSSDEEISADDQDSEEISADDQDSEEISADDQDSEEISADDESSDEISADDQKSDHEESDSESDSSSDEGSDESESGK
ncbi:hypothetical protein BMS3Abin02_01204 [bacterium BMS3Abin02]|nr:hypothetical protein BMS3Abin02_01204 [bacterium BMS3Abin02]GBE21610.1 hypothetical protein BMS3Bbin01_00955 [bacterium BMS3Bbin01]